MLRISQSIIQQIYFRNIKLQRKKVLAQRRGQELDCSSMVMVINGGGGRIRIHGERRRED